jgi:tetratricopeptide (TPR) repeat protein
MATSASAESSAPQASQEVEATAAAEAKPADATPAATTPRPATAKPAPPAARSGDWAIVRRDPAGVKGISPFWEAVVEGDKAYVAGEFAAATAAYKKAVQLEPDNAMGHLRLGRALFRSVGTGNATEAEREWLAALSRANNDPRSKSKALFLLADLSERKKAYEEATKRWTGYKEHAQSLKAIKTYPETADDRLRRIDEWQQLLIDYGEVRKRIEKNEREGEERKRQEAAKSVK